jgi:hypothetical protein
MGEIYIANVIRLICESLKKIRLWRYNNSLIQTLYLYKCNRILPMSMRKSFVAIFKMYCAYKLEVSVLKLWHYFIGLPTLRFVLLMSHQPA